MTWWDYGSALIWLRTFFRWLLWCKGVLWHLIRPHSTFFPFEPPKSYTSDFLPSEESCSSFGYWTFSNLLIIFVSAGHCGRQNLTLSEQWGRWYLMQTNVWFVLEQTSGSFTIVLIRFECKNAPFLYMWWFSLTLRRYVFWNSRYFN